MESIYSTIKQQGFIMKVHIYAHKQYEISAIKDSIRSMWEEDGLFPVLQKANSVLLKPNLLGAYLPERAVTTHPVVIEAVIQLLLELDKKILIGDSPGGTASLRKVLSKTGIDDLAIRYPIEVVHFGETGVTSIITKMDQLQVTNAIWEADVCINIAKYKTHGALKYTGAVKNLFGLVPGLKKSDYHRLYPESGKFSGLIADLYQQVKGRFVYHILDGVIGMEGDGPSAGVPRNFGLLFGGVCASAVDCIAAQMMGYHYQQLPLISQSLHNDGILPSRIQIEPLYHGFQFENVKKMQVRFKSQILKHLPKPVIKMIRTHFEYYPAFTDQCRLCRVCVNSCPVQAITLTKGNKHPDIDYAKCIKCLCCHELCPYQAIYIHKSTLAKVILGSAK